jgi:hypothetical protein
MKKQKIIRSITLGLGVFMLMVLAGADTAFAKTITLKNVNIPSKFSGPVFSTSFPVKNRGSFTVKVGVRIADIVGAGQSRYLVELMKENNTTVLASKEFLVTNYFQYANITFNVTNCGETGNYRFRIQNTSQDNPQPGEATFAPFEVPDLDPVSGTLSTFSVTQGNTVDRSIPTTPKNLQPSGSGGIMKITATWDSICGADPAGCRLTFRLRRNGETITSDNGYAHNALFGNASPKMTITYNVPANKVEGTWSLRVVGANLGNASNIKPTVSFTPVCQN